PDLNRLRSSSSRRPDPNCRPPWPATSHWRHPHRLRSESIEILIVVKARSLFDTGEGCFISEIQIGDSFPKSLLAERSRFKIIDRNLRRRLVDLFSLIRNQSSNPVRSGLEST
ncbi:hypothetical protein U1Q18_031040, partial [Sarracenia purpurea var. burkii]